MPSHTIPTNDGHLSNQLERMFVYMAKATRSIGCFVVFLTSSTVITATFGVPYFHYKLYRFTGGDSNEKWPEIIKSLEALWDYYCHLPIHMLPILFPMISSSGFSLCSAATFVATMTLIVGIISIATSSIYKLNTKALHNEHAIDQWLKASQPAWRKVPNPSFWVFMSLPTFVFFLSVSLFISTVMLTVWERSMIDMTPSLKIQSCSPNQLRTYKVISLVIPAPIIAHFAFLLTKMWSITTSQTAETAAVA